MNERTSQKHINVTQCSFHVSSLRHFAICIYLFFAVHVNHRVFYICVCVLMCRDGKYLSSILVHFHFTWCIAAFIMTFPRKKCLHSILTSLIQTFFFPITAHCISIKWAKFSIQSFLFGIQSSSTKKKTYQDFFPFHHRQCCSFLHAFKDV